MLPPSVCENKKQQPIPASPRMLAISLEAISWAVTKDKEIHTILVRGV